MFRLGVRGGPDAKFFSGIRVKIRDMSNYCSSLAPLYLVPVSRACTHAFYMVLVCVVAASSFIIYPSGAFTTSLFTFQVIELNHP